MTLTEFLLARIAEDEELLAFSEPLRIHVDPGGNGDASFPFQDRWLSECEAKRSIVAEHEIADWWAQRSNPKCETCAVWDASQLGEGPPPVDWPCPTLRALASIYSEHPDYQPEWSPDYVAPQAPSREAIGEFTIGTVVPPATS